MNTKQCFTHIKPSTMSLDEFVETFADIYEHSPWVAEKAFLLGPLNQFDEIDALHQAMSQCLLNASYDEQLALINAHPDLAGRAAMKGELTASSTAEQSGAGISECTPEEFDRFTRLNDTYKTRFGFPFIKAVKGSNRYQILDAFEQRITNAPDVEFQTALEEINKIARFRLETL